MIDSDGETKKIKLNSYKMIQIKSMHISIKKGGENCI